MIALLPTLALGLQAGAPSHSAACLNRPRAAIALEVRVPKVGDPDYDPELDPEIPSEPTIGEWFNNMPFAMSKSLARQTLLSQSKEPEPLPERRGLRDQQPRQQLRALPHRAAGPAVREHCELRGLHGRVVGRRQHADDVHARARLRSAQQLPRGAALEERAVLGHAGSE